jgi:hypothetical protein
MSKRLIELNFHQIIIFIFTSDVHSFVCKTNSRWNRKVIATERY